MVSSAAGSVGSFFALLEQIMHCGPKQAAPAEVYGFSACLQSLPRSGQSPKGDGCLIFGNQGQWG